MRLFPGQKAGSVTGKYRTSEQLTHVGGRLRLALVAGWRSGAHLGSWLGRPLAGRGARRRPGVAGRPASRADRRPTRGFDWRHPARRRALRPRERRGYVRRYLDRCKSGASRDCFPCHLFQSEVPGDKNSSGETQMWPHRTRAGQITAVDLLIAAEAAM